MRRLYWFLAGAFSLAIAVACATLIFLKTGADGFSARAHPSLPETIAARAARNFALPAGARERRNPVPGSSEVLAEARAHWADHCAVCHANDGSGRTEMGQNMYPPAPDMRGDATQRMTDGELFWIIENGVRLSGMPAWGGPGQPSELDSWKLVLFIRHLPQLTFEEKKEMEKLNPKGPAERKDEEDEEKFLRGEDNYDQPAEHHNH